MAELLLPLLVSALLVSALLCTPSRVAAQAQKAEQISYVHHAVHPDACSSITRSYSCYNEHVTSKT